MDNLLLDLGDQPLVNNLCKSRSQSLSIEKFPLRAKYNDDLLINLDTEVPPNFLYKEYLYRSGINIPYIKHCEKCLKQLNILNLK